MLRYPNVLSAWHLPSLLRLLLPGGAWDTVLSWLLYLCLKLILSLSCCPLLSFLWMFMGLPLLSPSCRHRFIFKQDMGFHFADNSLLPLYFESVALNSASPKYLSMQAGILFFVSDISLCCQTQHDQSGIPDISHQNDSLSIRMLEMAAVWCLVQWLQRRMLNRRPQTPSPKHQSRQVRDLDKWRAA